MLLGRLTPGPWYGRKLGLGFRGRKVGRAGMEASSHSQPRLCPSALCSGVCPWPLCGTQSVPVCARLAG